MPVRSLASLVAVGVALVSSPGHAQEPAGATPVAGSLVRVATTAPDRPPVVGRLVSITRDSIAFQRVFPLMAASELARMDTTVIALHDVTGLEMRAGTRQHKLRGAMIGALSGGVALSVVAAASYKPCESTVPLGCLSTFDSRGAVAYFGAIDGAVIGAVVGTIVGAIVASDIWVPASIASTTHFELVPRPNGWGARLSYSIR